MARNRSGAAAWGVLVVGVVLPILGLPGAANLAAGAEPAKPPKPAERAALAEPAEPAEPDLSSPAKALAFFVKSLEKGDAAGLQAVSAGDEKQLEWVRAEAAQWSALRDLESALAKRYGADYAASDKGKEAKERIAEARDADLHDDLAKAKLGAAKQGGAKAGGKDEEVVVVLDENAPDSHQGRLVRVEERWKLDLASLSDYLAPNDVPVLKAVGVTAAALARDVAAGKFATPDEAADAIDERLNAAVESALPKKTPEPPPPPAQPRRLPRPAGK